MNIRAATACYPKPWSTHEVIRTQPPTAAVAPAVAAAAASEPADRSRILEAATELETVLLRGIN